MATKSKAWKPAPPRRAKPEVPRSIKRILEEKAHELIENKLKPEHIRPPPSGGDWNYLVDIYSKWYRNYFYFCAKYNCPSPNAISSSFETKFARMEYVGNEQFNLSYMRHTERWLEMYQGLPLEQCLKAIVEEPYFAP
jgi:hypothetical protein